MEGLGGRARRSLTLAARRKRRATEPLTVGGALNGRLATPAPGGAKASARPLKPPGALASAAGGGGLGAAPQRPLQGGAAAHPCCACPVCPRALPCELFSRSARRARRPGWSALRSRGVRGRAAPAKGWPTRRGTRRYLRGRGGGSVRSRAR